MIVSQFLIVVARRHTIQIDNANRFLRFSTTKNASYMSTVYTHTALYTTRIFDIHIFISFSIQRIRKKIKIIKERKAIVIKMHFVYKAPQPETYTYIKNEITFAPSTKRNTIRLHLPFAIQYSAMFVSYFFISSLYFGL